MTTLTVLTPEFGPIAPDGGVASGLAPKSGLQRHSGEMQRVCEPACLAISGLPLLVEYIDGVNWRLHRDISFRLADGRVSTVLAGFVFDFASVPRVLWRVFPPAGIGRNRYGLAAAWHDWLYEHQQMQGTPISREDADRVFLEIMLAVEVSLGVALAMFVGVRLGGAITWWWNGRKKGTES